MAELSELTDRAVCDLSTVGRVSGQPRTIEIWFAVEGDAIFLLSGGGTRANWVRNLIKTPEVRVEIGHASWHGTARVLSEGPDAERCRQALYAKYQPRYRGDLAGWRDASLPVVIEHLTPDDQQE